VLVVEAVPVFAELLPKVTIAAGATAANAITTVMITTVDQLSRHQEHPTALVPRQQHVAEDLFAEAVLPWQEEGFLHFNSRFHLLPGGSPGRFWVDQPQKPQYPPSYSEEHKPW
jgi:hypothetical protein